MTERNRKESRSHNSLNHLWLDMPVQSWLKKKSWATDYRFGNRGKLCWYRLYFSIGPLSTEITTEREQGCTRGLHSYFSLCFRPWTMQAANIPQVSSILLKAISLPPTPDKTTASFKLPATSTTRGLHFIRYAPWSSIIIVPSSEIRRNNHLLTYVCNN